MLLNLRAALIAALAVSAATKVGLAQGPSKTLRYEAAKPRVDAEAVPTGYVTRSGYSEVAPSPSSVAAQPTPTVSPSDAYSNGEWNDNYYYGFHDGAWYGGAEYLLVRPHFSENTAYVHRTDVLNQNGSSTQTDETVSYEFDYQSSVRAFFGYRLCECGGEIQFTYWNYNIKDGSHAGPVPDDLSQIFAGHLENNAQIPGQSLSTAISLDINSFDIEFAKRIPLGDCCDCCPVWDLKWSAGVRISDVERHHNNLVTNEDGSGFSAGFITQTFVGAGPRMGLEGRRYLCDCMSAYMKGNWTLLLGEYDTTRQRDTPPQPNTLATTIQTDRYSRIIPIMELECGLSWQIRQHCMLTCGYTFQSWWDLGMFEQMQGTNFGPEDDSNIMSFDGLVARIEFVF